MRNPIRNLIRNDRGSYDPVSLLVTVILVVVLVVILFAVLGGVSLGGK